MDAVSVRPFADDDAEATARIYFDAVRIGAKDHYNESQRRAWAPDVPETKPWRDRLKSQHTFIAEHEERVVGFMTIDDAGCIDLAFVAPDMTARGVAGCLYDVVEAHAARSAIPKLHSHASHLARPFFERRGWVVIAEQSVSRGGVVLTNFRMEKHLEVKQAD